MQLHTHVEEDWTEDLGKNQFGSQERLCKECRRNEEVEDCNHWLVC